jgi:uncharacterized integral membrane protein (TIGR00698 family)
MSEIRKVQPRAESQQGHEWSGSMEGLPEWVDPIGPRDPQPWQRGAQALFEELAAVLPGLTIAAVIAFGGTLIANGFGATLGFERTPLSPILVSILLGLVLRNAIGLPAAYHPGVRLCQQRILRLGVALLGFRLSLAALGTIGAAALPIVTASIVTALLVVGWINRALGLHPRLGTLIAVGTAICGNSAIVATAPVIGAEEEEVSYAVGCVTLFGMLALLTYPFLSDLLFPGDALSSGIFLGTAIHDTAQVAGAALLAAQYYAMPEILDTALVTKLLRNVFMIIVIPGMAVRYHRRAQSDASSTTPAALSLRQAVPGFVLGFVAMALLRTLGELGESPVGGLVSAESWQSLVDGASSTSTWGLMLAMSAVGLGTDLRRVRRLGLRPLAVGLVAAAVVGCVSALGIRALSGA